MSLRHTETNDQVPTHSIDMPQNVLNLLTGLPDVLFVAVMGGRGFVETVQQQRVPEAVGKDHVVRDHSEQSQDRQFSDYGHDALHNIGRGPSCEYTAQNLRRVAITEDLKLSENDSHSQKLKQTNTTKTNTNNNNNNNNNNKLNKMNAS